MDNPLVLVHLYPYVSICLARDGSGLDEVPLMVLTWVHAVAALGRVYFARHWAWILLFLPSTH
jgi:hypothetical protein